MDWDAWRICGLRRARWGARGGRRLGLSRRRGRRGAAHDTNVRCLLASRDPEPERYRASALSAWESMHPFSPASTNFLADEPLDHVKVASGDHAYERLTAVKSRCDPTNFFRFKTHNPPQPMTGGECPE